MFRYLVKRVLQSVVTLFVVSVVTFLMFFAVPSSPAYVMCGKNCDAGAIKQVEERLGLRDPLTVQYGKFIKGIFVGRDYGAGDFHKHCPAPCLGYSFKSGELVTSILARTTADHHQHRHRRRVVWLFIGIGLGMLSALRKGTVFDRVAIGVSLVGASMQVYFLGLVLLVIFVLQPRSHGLPAVRADHRPTRSPGSRR